MDEKLLVFVLGAPGSGKGTQCELVRREFGWSHISAGDLLRAQVAAGTEVGQQAEAIMKEGKLVPSSMIIGLLKEAISCSEHTKVLVDGFPRVVDQLKDFEQQVRPCDAAFFYEVTDATAMERLSKRAEISGRVDDNAETIRKRFVVFEQESMPVVGALRADGRLVEIDAAAPAEVVYESTRQTILQLEERQLQRQVAAASGAGSTPLPGSDAVAMSVLSASQSEAVVGDDAGSDLESATVAAAAATTTAAPGTEASSLSATSAAEAGETPGQGAQQSFEDITNLAAEPTPEAAAVPAENQDVALSREAVEPVVSDVSASIAALNIAEDQSSTSAQPPVGSETAQAHAASDSMQQQPAVAAASNQQIDPSSIRTPFVICGPSGVGKGTLINKLMTQYPDKFGFSVSHTTRDPRPGEQHGVHYNFTDIPSMKQQVAAGLFLEHAEVHGNMYGTSLAAVAQVSGQGKHCVLDIDVQGARQVMASAVGPSCVFIFIAPPSQEELERRLRNRGTETEEKVLQRLANAKAEIEQGQEPGLFDHIIVNADLEVAYHKLQQLVNQAVPGLLPDLLSVPPDQPASTVQVAEAPAIPDSSTASPATSAVQIAEAPAAPQSSTANSAISTVPQVVASMPPAAMANGSTTARQQTPAAAVVGSGTSTLLDFGFGASAGPAVAIKGMPVRQYMDATVIPVLREGLKALNSARPDDPLQYLADFLVAHKPVTH